MAPFSSPGLCVMLCALIAISLPLWAVALGGANSVVHRLGDPLPVPTWHNLFNIEFNETSVILFKRTTTGKWYYDAANGNEVILRDDGRGDRYCGSIHAFTATPCTHLVTGGNRYLIFPELNECCLCCAADMGCGILSPNWLDGAEFQAIVEQNGHFAYKWVKKGLQSNYYYATADATQIPVELDQWPNNWQSFHVETFSTEAIDPRLLEVPANCNSRCPIKSLCTIAAVTGKALH